MVINTARRFVYPFAPALSRNLDVPLTAITTFIAISWATTIVTIFFGPFIDRLGYRFIMIIALMMLAVGMLMAGLFPFYNMILIALILAAIGKSIFDPASQAYISERVPYRKRALVIGILQLSWAGATLLGIPIIGLLIANFGWRSPFFILGALGFLGVLSFQISFPSNDLFKQRSKSKLEYKKVLKELLRKKVALGMFGYAFFIGVASDNLFVVYGAWLEKTFNLSIVALGIGTSVIGIAELLGEIGTATLADRLGLKVAAIIGLILSILCYSLLPLFEQTLAMALSGLFFIFLTFEFTLVTALSLCTELLPKFRATMIAGFFSAAGFGHVVGAFIGGPIWLKGGIIATSFVSAIINCLALASLVWGLRGWIKR
jgi:predicted MFS family arabinose efflux permease